VLTGACASGSHDPQARGLKSLNDLVRASWVIAVGGLRDRGWWYAEFDLDALRRYSVHVLYHEVGHHLDWYERRWSAANLKQAEDADDEYAVRFAREGQTVISRLREPPESH
jgi:hypothetical protein